MSIETVLVILASLYLGGMASGAGVAIITNYLEALSK